MKAKESKIFELKPIKLKECIIEVKGKTPLISHAWSEKAKKEMLNKCMKKNVEARPAKDPFKDFMETLYWITPRPNEFAEEAFNKAIKDGAKFGYKATAFKSAIASDVQGKIANGWDTEQIINYLMRI